MDNALLRCIPVGNVQSYPIGERFLLSEHIDGGSVPRQLLFSSNPNLHSVASTALQFAKPATALFSNRSSSGSGIARTCPHPQPPLLRRPLPMGSPSNPILPLSQNRHLWVVSYCSCRSQHDWCCFVLAQSGGNNGPTGLWTIHLGIMRVDN